MQVSKIAIPGKIKELEHPIEVTIMDQYGIDIHLVDGILRGFYDYQAVIVKYDTTYSDGSVNESDTACIRDVNGANMLKVMPKEDPYITDVTITVLEVINNVQ